MTHLSGNIPDGCVFLMRKYISSCPKKYLQYTRWGYILYVEILIDVKIKDKEKGMAEDKKCCCKKKKERTDSEKKLLLNRLKRIEGQIRGIYGMVEDDAYCIDILNQSLAANAALTAFDKALLSNHIKTCVVEDIKNGDDEVVDELVMTLQKFMK